MKKALMIASEASMLDNFNRNNIKLLLSMGYAVTLAADFSSMEDSSPRQRIEKFEKDMSAWGCNIVQIDFSRQLSNINKQYCSYKQVRKLVDGKFDLIHCHSPICAALTRFVFRGERKRGTRVIYTAHGFHFFKGAPLKNWLLYYPIERFLSRWTDVLILINNEDYELAVTKFHAKKTIYIPGVGVDIDKFSIHYQGNKIKRELGIEADGKVLLSVGELNKNKNHETIIRALPKLGDGYYYIIVGQGCERENLERISRELGVENKVKLVGFRDDVANFYDAADVFVFPSLREGLSVALMEAMASELPIVCSRIRGNIDLLDEGKGGYFFESSEADDAADSIKKIMKEDKKEFGAYNLKKIRELDLNIIEKLYAEMYRGGV